MPLFGTLDIDQAMQTAPTMADLTPETMELPSATVLQVSYEVAHEPALTITPPALHPSIPPYVTFNLYHHPSSPLGPFDLVTVRLIVRAGIRPRGLLLQAFCSDEGATEHLATRWGYRVRTADITQQQRHDRISATVSIDGSRALGFALTESEPVSGGDLELFDNLHLTQLPDQGPVIVQVDPSYQYAQAQRGVPQLDVFDAEVLGVQGVEPVYPIVAVSCVADMTLSAPRFVLDPTQPAVKGTKRVG